MWGILMGTDVITAAQLIELGSLIGLLLVACRGLVMLGRHAGHVEAKISAMAVATERVALTLDKHIQDEERRFYMIEKQLMAGGKAR